MEIPMSHSVVLGYLPSVAENDYNNNYIKVTEDMTDEQIIKTIDTALEDKLLLEKMADDLYDNFRNKYSYEKNYENFMDIISQVIS